MSDFETILSRAEIELSEIVGTKISLSVSLSPRTADQMIYAFTGGHDDDQFNMLTTIVADYYGITKDQLFGKSKESRVAQARQIVYFLACEVLHMHVNDIAYKSKRERSTVIRMIACTKVQKDHPIALAENLKDITKYLLTELSK